MQENYEIFKDLIQTVVLLYKLTVCSGDIKRKESSEIKALKMTSQLVIPTPPPPPPPPPNSDKTFP